MKHRILANYTHVKKNTTNLSGDACIYAFKKYDWNSVYKFWQQRAKKIRRNNHETETTSYYWVNPVCSSFLKNKQNKNFEKDTKEFVISKLCPLIPTSVYTVSIKLSEHQEKRWFEPIK